jgi:hypothetical protein
MATTRRWCWSTAWGVSSRYMVPLARQLGGRRCARLLPGRAHTLNFNAPVEVADVVGDFVARITREGQRNARQP